MDWRRAGSPTYGRRRSPAAGLYSAPASPAHPLGGGATSATASPVHPLAARSKARAAAAMAHAMSRQQPHAGARDDDDDGYGAYDADDGLADGNGNGRYNGGGRSPLRGGAYGYGGRSPLHPAAGGGGGGGGGVKDKYFGFALPKLGRNGVDSAAVNRPPSTGRSTFAPPVGVNVRPLQAVEIPNGTPKDRRAVYPDPTFAQSTRSRDSHDSSTITEELEMLKDENVNLLEKLGLAEEKLRQSEARTIELEKQVANLGDGLSMEVKLMKRREEMLVRKEQEIRKALISKNGKSEELTALQQQLQSAKEEASAAVKKLKEAESETKDLRTMTRRMVLSKEEMEEVVMKRCWLARYWGLAVQYGIYPDISMSKHEYWSSLAPLPFEYVTSAGQRAKNGSETGSDGLEDADKLVHDLTVTAGEGNVETMLSVDKGLQELAFLKVEDAVLFALAQHHRSNVVGPADPDIKSTGDEKFTEAFDLSKEEEEDVKFKQAWLIYFWRRAKTHNVEEDIAEERLQMWIDRHSQEPTSHDAVDVEQGLHELRKLGIEQLLWELSRHEVNLTKDDPSDVEDLT
ncbi:coiled-coil domain-containing protein SCD2 isoform X2 [Setaria italica]|uniref:coiled-coil domain-containing protein SCD2 isoform X2 n=1 Tax=Setaria italica TaxID=4555 RepID=UPI000BE4F320|nr:coiled-coil domain-containing protein SCD2 isoform X2 [Setaria italica]